MIEKNIKIGIVVDDDFASKNSPPYPKPSFLSFETPLRIKSILDYFNNRINLFEDERIVKINPKIIEDSVIELAHSKYYIESIKWLSKCGSGLLSDEVFVTKDTFSLAKLAVGGVIKAIESVLNKEVNQSFALVRPPGHHSLREMGSGLCIFNNIANGILYLRKVLKYKKKIAIIDIDDHFGGSLCQYFYSDPSVLYFSIHEFDFIEGDIGFIKELGEGGGLGKNINFPIPTGMGDEEFLEFMEVLTPVLREYNPDLIIIAAGFDMHYSDPIGNCNLTSISYFKFTKEILNIANELCKGKLVYVLEGGYSLIALPYCVHAIIKGLLGENYEQPEFENLDFSDDSMIEEINKIKTALKNQLNNYWKLP